MSDSQRTPSRLPGITGIISIIVGIAFVVAGGVTWGLVSSQLAAEEITVADDARWFAGAPVRDPFTAFSQADIINTHALNSTDGRTYAELGDEMAELRAAGAAEDDPELAELQQARSTVMNASFLRASLFTSVVAFGVAALVIGLGVVIALIGFALRAVGRAPAPAVAGGSASTPSSTRAETPAETRGEHRSGPDTD